MKKFYEIKMDIRANNYVKEIISEGLSLSSKIGNAIELSKGSVFTFFPNGISPTNLYDFQIGGKLPEPGEETWTREKYCIRKPIPNTRAFLVDIIHEYMQKERDNICIFENTFASKSDPWLERIENRKDRVFFYKDEVYHMVLNKNSGIRDIEQAIRYAKSVCYLLGVMSALPIEEQTTEYGEISDKKWDLILRNLKKIIVSAYDGEGYLIWERE